MKGGVELTIKVLAACGVGMSMSHLMHKMEIAAKNRGIDMSIKPSGVDALRLSNFAGVDVIILGPHVRYQEKAVSEKAVKTGTKVVVIPEQLYATFNAERVLDHVLEALKPTE